MEAPKKHRLIVAGTATEAHSSSDIGDSGLMGQFARAPALPREFGKCDCDLKVWLPGRVKSDIAMLARHAGMSPGEWTRLNLMKILYGAEVARRVHTKGIDEVLALGGDSDPESGERA